MIPSSFAAVQSWFLPPVCGAVVGGALGFFVLGRLAARAAADSVPGVTRLGLALPVGDLVPKRGSPAASSLESAVAGILGGLVGSRSFIYAVRGLVSQVIAGVSKRKVSDVARDLGLQSFLAERVLPAIGSESNRRSIARAAGVLFSESAGSALGDEVLQNIAGVFESYVPEAADAVLRWLRSEETRASLAERGRELLPRILERLSDMQKFFIAAGQFDRRLNEKMPEIVDDTIAAVEKMVRDPAQQGRIVSQFEDSARGWRDTVRSAPTGAPEENTAREKLSGTISSLVSSLLGRMEDPDARGAVAGRANRSLLEDRRTVGVFAREVFGISDAEMTELVSARVLSFLVRPETSEAISRHVCGLLFSFVEENALASVGEILKIDEERKRLLDDVLRGRVPRMVAALAPRAGAAFRRSARPARFAAAFGAALGCAIGLVLDFLRFLGYS